MAEEGAPWTLRVEQGPHGGADRIARDLTDLGYSVTLEHPEGQGAAPLLQARPPGSRQRPFWQHPEVAPSLLHQVSDAILICDPETRVLFMNQAARALFPDPASPAVPESGFAPGHLAPSLEHALGGKEVVDQGVTVGDPHGDKRELLVSARPVRDPSGALRGAVVVARELTGEHRWRRSLEQARDLYAALSETNQFLVTTPPPEELFARVAQIVVDYAGFQLAWVGLVDEEGWVRPTATHGQAHPYVNDIRVAASADVPEGRGPTGICVRTGEHVISRRVLEDPHMGPWRGVAERHGLRSSGAFPIRRNGMVVGALNVYSGLPDFLSEELVHLLDEMVLDISFALDNYDRNERLRQLAEIIEGSPDFIGMVDPRGNVLYRNPAALRLLGRAALKPNLQDAHPDWATRKIQQEGLPRARTEGVWNGETAFLDSTGREVPFSQTIIAHRDRHGALVRYSTIARDITDWHRAQARIQQLAYQDPVTNLANRAHLLERLEGAITRLDHAGRYGALLALDLDSFQTINDSLGPGVGDALLHSVGDRLASVLPEGDLLARVGADEFILLMADLSGSRGSAEQAAERVAQQIEGAFDRPFPARNAEFHLTASMGLALLPEPDCAPGTYLQRVGSALSAAKAERRGSRRFFRPEMVSTVQHRLDLEQELRGALNRDELHLVFQPIWDLDSNRISGLETLVRWEHPQRGPISPGEFIPIAEQTGLIQPLGRWILETAVRTVKPWLEGGVELPAGLAVNISPQQFSGRGFVECIAETLESCAFPGRHLKLEITESLLMQNLSLATAKIQQLRELGVTFAVDDFGTGYSSLAYLDQLPLEALKIDRSFVNRIEQGDSAGRIIEAVIDLANNLELNVVGEGIETEAQRRFLCRQGCLHGQGFLLSPPLSGEELAHRLFGPSGATGN
ncbi:EAL domain-containing protein [Thiohalorhabdus sp. Cl-TMA]|uniref:EAL domain-containing protein n=1 Tax=Thiohalorhabdus methylotrophus TaxID=3242694 RepID=A0ABV4TVA1_9GAMM